MTSTWKDVVTTIFAALVVLLYYIKTTTALKIPLISGNYRWSILTLAIIGILMCAFSSTVDDNHTNILLIISNILGIFALILIIYGLIVGTKIAFVSLSTVILLLWLTATVRHVLSK